MTRFFSLAVLSAFLAGPSAEACNGHRVGAVYGGHYGYSYGATYAPQRVLLVPACPATIIQPTVVPQYALPPVQATQYAPVQGVYDPGQAVAPLVQSYRVVDNYGAAPATASYGASYGATYGSTYGAARVGYAREVVRVFRAPVVVAPAHVHREVIRTRTVVGGGGFNHAIFAASVGRFGGFAGVGVGVGAVHAHSHFHGRGR